MTQIKQIYAGFVFPSFGGVRGGLSFLSFMKSLCALCGKKLTILFLTILSIFSLPLNAQQPELIQGVWKQDYEALKAIYEALGGRFWKSENDKEQYLYPPNDYPLSDDLDNWLNPYFPVKDWYGVDTVDHRVTRIILMYQSGGKSLAFRRRL